MFIINQTPIGKNYKPYIIAELSANHGGSLNRAKETIKSAKLAGANAIKIQSYTPDTMTINSNKKDFKIKRGLWKNYNLYELYEQAYTPFEWHFELFEYAKQLDITLFSTPFDETAVDLLVQLNTPAFKIASFELTDLPLIQYIAKRKKPIFMSTGMASLDEIHDAIEICKTQNNNDIILFHCISSYPSKTTEANLNNIKLLATHFNIDVGLSDHTKDNLTASLAISLGACAIEKHFKLDDNDNGPDSSFSLLPSQFSHLVEVCNLSFLALGSNKKFNRSETEKENKIFRRSIYFIKDLKKGHIISNTDIKRIRPGFGLKPKYFDDIIGKQLTSDVERGDPVTWKVLK